MDAPAHGTFALAGAYAQAWFRRLEVSRIVSDEDRILADEILDCALADAGIRPLDRELADALHGYSLKA